MTEDTIAARLARLEDRAAIEELVARYTLHAAAAEHEALAALFTADGVFHAHSGPVQGREALVAFFRTALTPGRSVPIVGQLHVSFGEEGRARLKCLMASTFDNGVPGGFCGHYDDELAKVGGDWLFTSRNYRFYQHA